MMTKTTELKVNNLRALIPETGITYDHLLAITTHAAALPSITTLRKYNLLQVVSEMTYEETMTMEKADQFDPAQLIDWGWFIDGDHWTYIHGLKYYKVA